MNDFIIDKLKEIKQIQNLIELNELDYVTNKMENIMISA